MEKPTIAGKSPMPVELEAGKTYAWCSCGQSSNQPWCDGTHQPTNFTPVVFKAEETKTAYMCNCKHSGTPQFCDGTHTKL
ncbi:CDGSH iron-sulfur domain-containing protein [Aureispira sp. CCB-E]|uniref:CDGSH iron-sulfur domain-containing protein n=1 Tax=Aureispira sp. CCB-E TaxID=3051121 RepID=UPI0028692BC4|nr:CDGSH iron-sulfur domain-containing protein [Aureispira sp. CCB-E]WMX14400.1 CDGSH iron-sulfur domain-containing protein [Aureispira sp. CCB-E]